MTTEEQTHQSTAPDVSVVVPIYNVERYLRQCLESIQAQTCTSIEVLCVNDGSTDGSAAIIQEIAAKDDRFIFLDKPNGGYGHSVNYGLDRARGRYVAVVEPDDFLDPAMYAELLAFANANPNADIVKGSYWEYFDGRDGFDEELQAPLLMQHLPKAPFTFKLADYTPIFRFHPSIWSAIYKHSFLTERSIRFIEPKGAGWADNPFFAETMLQAEEIVWVPKPYYYYRQTNEVASSFVQDASIPFDRIADMHKVLQRCNATEDIWAAQYMRDFSYIHSVVGEFGFSEADPTVAARIRETLMSMNPDIVRTHPMMLSYDIRYYEEFLGLDAGAGGTADDGAVSAADSAADGAAASAREVRTSADVADIPTDGAAASAKQIQFSFILPVQNDGDVAKVVLDSILACAFDSFEVICVDCGCADRSMALIKTAAAHDGRIRVLSGVFETVGAGSNAAIQQVRAPYFYVVDFDHALDSGAFTRLVQRARTTKPDVIILGEGEPSSVDALLSAGREESLVAQPLDFEAAATVEGFVAEFVLGPVVVNEAASYIFTCVNPAARCLVYRTEAVRAANIQAATTDAQGDGALGGSALAAAQTVQLAFGPVFTKTVREDWNVLFTLEQHESFVTEAAPVLPSVRQFVDGLGQDVTRWQQGIADYALRAFFADLETRKTYASMKAYCDEHLGWLQNLVGDTSGRAFAHPRAFDAYQRLTVQGLDSYLALMYFHRDVSTRWNKREVDAWRNSMTMQLGMKVKQVANAVIPRKLVAKIRGNVAGKGGQ